MMHQLSIIELAKFRDSPNYKLIDKGIYKDLTDTEGFCSCRIAVCLHKNDIVHLCRIQKQLEKLFIYIEDILDFGKSNTIKLILGGDFEDLLQFITTKN